jgi:hypothetical protein
MTSVAVLEWLTLAAPLGAQLRDDATGTGVAGGLSVIVYPAGEPERWTAGSANGSGIFVFRNLPSLHDADLTPRFPFVLEVRDPRGRYLPFRRNVDLPRRGVQTFPLFSAAGRAIPDGMSALRMELHDVGGGPAAWALVEATAGEQRVMTGVADADGRVLVPLLYPKPVVTFGSPGIVRRPLTEQEWPVDVTIRYRRRDPIPNIPDLDDILSQPPATALLPASPPAPLTRATLRFGRELAIPAVLIQPAGSPP